MSVPEGSRLYSKLKLRARASGAFERSYLYYGVLAVVAFIGYAASGAAIVLLDGIVPLVAACLAFSFFSVQIAGIMHDCGHRAVFASTRNNDLLGTLAAASVGMIFNSWRLHHNQHHAFPNQAGRDPDFAVPLTAFTPDQMGQKNRVGKWVSRFQAYYFYAILATASLSNRLGGITYFLARRKGTPVELILYIPAVTVLIAGPFILFPLDKALLVFVVVHFTSGLYLANCFAPNHKGMTTLPRETDLCFFEQQVVTARNIRGGVLADVLMVGLNHQIEHHLFPATPRNKLSRIREDVIEACSESGIAYGETSFTGSARRILVCLNGVSQETRTNRLL